MKTLIVLCLINVTVPWKGQSGVTFERSATDTIVGKVISQNSVNYLVDFSVNAKRKGLLGDYTKRFVNKDKCMVQDEK